MTQRTQLRALRHLPSRPHLTLTSPQYPQVYPPWVLVRVPCGLPACLPAPTTTGAGKQRVWVRVSLRTPRGIPVLLPTHMSCAAALNGSRGCFGPVFQQVAHGHGGSHLRSNKMEVVFDRQERYTNRVSGVQIICGGLHPHTLGMTRYAPTT